MGYSNDFNQRYELLKICKSDTCYVPMIKHFPRTLYLSGMSTQMKMVEFHNPNIKVAIQMDSTRKTPKKIGF